jgi:hypothetical protein
MDRRIAAVELQVMESCEKRDDNPASKMIQPQTERSKNRDGQYLRNLTGGLHVVEIDVLELSRAERLNIYNSLGINRFVE